MSVLKINGMVYNNEMSFIDYLSTNAEAINQIQEKPVDWKQDGKECAKDAVQDLMHLYPEISELPDSLSRQDVIDAFNEDLFKGFIMGLLWSRFLDDNSEDCRNFLEHIYHNRKGVVKLLEKAKKCLKREELHKAISFRQSKAFGKSLDLSHWSKTLYFLSRLLESPDFRCPIIYDENLKNLHAAIILSTRDDLVFYETDKQGKLVSLQSEEDKEDERYIDYCRRVIYTCQRVNISSPSQLTSVFSDDCSDDENPLNEVGKAYWRKRLTEIETEEAELLSNKDCKKIEWYCKLGENPYDWDDDDEYPSDDFLFFIYYRIDGKLACCEQYAFTRDINNVRGIFFDLLELINITNYDGIKREKPFNLDNVRLRKTCEIVHNYVWNAEGYKIELEQGKNYIEYISEDTGEVVERVDATHIVPKESETILHHYGYLVGSEDEIYVPEACIGGEHDDLFRKCLAYLLFYGEYINVFHREIPNPLL